MQVAIISLMWALFLGLFIRSVWAKRIMTASAQRYLLQIFLACLALSFWGQDAEKWLDHYFADLPIAVYVKYFAFLFAVKLFEALPRQSIEGWEEHHRWLKGLFHLAIFSGLISFAFYAVYQPVDKTLWRYWVIGARDGFIIFSDILLFVPAILILWRRERVFAMRIQLSSTLGLVLCHLVTALSSVTAAGFASYSLEYAKHAAATAQPFIVLGVCFFIPMFVPHRGLNLLLHIKRLYTYHRLKTLRQRIINYPMPEPKLIRNSSELELAIYRNVIAILDYYPPLEWEDVNLYQQIHQCITTTTNYEDLLQAMVQL